MIFFRFPSKIVFIFWETQSPNKKVNSYSITQNFDNLQYYVMSNLSYPSYLSKMTDVYLTRASRQESVTQVSENINAPTNSIFN